jgi:hypothetical protein
MGKTYSSDAEHQKRHFVRQNKNRYADEVEGSSIDSIKKSFKPSVDRYGNERKQKDKFERRSSKRFMDN